VEVAGECLNLKSFSHSVLPHCSIQSPLWGLIGAAKSVLKNAAKLSSLVLREGVSVPFDALGMFRRQNAKEGAKAAE
jgi:hypothetical protein